MNTLTRQTYSIRDLLETHPHSAVGVHLTVHGHIDLCARGSSLPVPRRDDLECLSLLDSQEPRSVATLDVTGPTAKSDAPAVYVARIMIERDVRMAIDLRVSGNHLNARKELFVAGHFNNLPHGARMCKRFARIVSDLIVSHLCCRITLGNRKPVGPCAVRLPVVTTI